MPRKTGIALWIMLVVLGSHAIAQLPTSSLPASSLPTSSWAWADPEAKLLLGIDVRSLRESPALQSFGSQLSTELTAQLQPLGIKIPHIPGIEMLNEINRVFISSASNFTSATGGTPRVSANRATPNRPAAANTAAANTRFVGVLEGDFVPEHVRGLLSGTHFNLQGIEVYREKGSGDQRLAMLDAHTILIGDDLSVRKAIERRARGGAQPQALLARAAELSAHSDIWMIMTDLTSSAPAGATSVDGVMSQVEGIDLGLALREGLTVDMSLVAKTEAGAQFFSQMMTSQLPTAASQIADPQAAELLRKLQISTAGKQMRLHIALSREELQQNMTRWQLARTPTGRAAGPASPGRSSTPAAPAPVAPPPATPGKIKIYGLDEGVREIPLN